MMARRVVVLVVLCIAAAVLAVLAVVLWSPAPETDREPRRTHAKPS